MERTLSHVQNHAEEARKAIIVNYLISKEYELVGFCGQDPVISFYRNKKSIVCVPAMYGNGEMFHLAIEHDLDDFMRIFNLEQEEVDAIGKKDDPIDTDNIAQYIQEEHDYSFSCC